jgi:hypothetical protein
VEYEDGFPSKQQMDAIMAGIAVCTQLTKLEMDVGVEPEVQDEDDDDDIEEQVPVAVCASLAGLPNLRDLTISVPSYMVPGDALALSALTALTRLDLSGAGGGVDDVAASALACSLKQLCYLDLGGSRLSMACLAPIGQLSQLTALVVVGVEGLTERGLMLLTRLYSLQSLSVKQNAEVTNEVLDRFWAAVRQQQH